MKIAFICVNYNNFEYTKLFIESLERQIGFGKIYSPSCYVVDNSDIVEDSISCLQIVSQNKWCKYLRPEKNDGYFGGLNYALLNLPVGEFFAVVICNNDLIFSSDFCLELLRLNFDKNVFVLCPDVITKDGYHQNPHLLNPMSYLKKFVLGMYFYNFSISIVLSAVLKFFRPVKKPKIVPLIQCEIYMGIGACYVLTGSFFINNSQLNYPHFLYGEEAYLSKQVHDKKGILVFCPNLKVTHAESAALSRLPKRETYEFARSGFKQYRKYL